MSLTHLRHCVIKRPPKLSPIVFRTLHSGRVGTEYHYGDPSAAPAYLKEASRPARHSTDRAPRFIDGHYRAIRHLLGLADHDVPAMPIKRAPPLPSGTLERHDVNTVSLST